MAIKLKIKKLELESNLELFAQKVKLEDTTMMPITERHIFQYNNVPLVETHKDPFDRLLIATAVAENLPIITIDKQFDNYKKLIEVIW